jgi:hypothetical protein
MVKDVEEVKNISDFFIVVIFLIQKVGTKIKLKMWVLSGPLGANVPIFFEYVNTRFLAILLATKYSLSFGKYVNQR